ncbi:hypothetical protein FW320_10890 [Azospirillum sp. Vi22]|nr:hypothetical protein [Azospirillum baldaniorum]
MVALAVLLVLGTLVPVIAPKRLCRAARTFGGRVESERAEGVGPTDSVRLAGPDSGLILDSVQDQANKNGKIVLFIQKSHFLWKTGAGSPILAAQPSVSIASRVYPACSTSEESCRICARRTACRSAPWRAGPASATP